jgi:NADPH-dependent 2,4-dienoyl-CoA reductase/sulfur reductase-like enzyme
MSWFNFIALARAFRERGFPVIVVNVAARAPGRAETTTDEVLSQLQEQARPTNIALPQ